MFEPLGAFELIVVVVALIGVFAGGLFLTAWVVARGWRAGRGRRGPGGRPN